VTCIILANFKILRKIGCYNELTNVVVDLVKSSRRSDMKASHVMDQRSTNQEVDQWTKLVIGFKDDRTINGHKVIERGTTWWSPAMMNQ
jgi:hypothetical protein